MTATAELVGNMRKVAEEMRTENPKRSHHFVMPHPHQINQWAATIETLAAALVEARKDTARLDYLDRCNERLNATYGTNYGWSLILNHNVNRLMLGHMLVDLHDSEGGKSKLPSCRAAIDARIEALSRDGGGDGAS